MRIHAIICACMLCVVLSACKPTVIILSPRTGACFEAGQTVSFACLAIDLTHGMLRGSSVLWRSNRDGTLGSGALLHCAGLSPGEHVIMVEATDPENWHNAATCSITVVSRQPASTTTSAETSTTVVATTTSTAISPSTTTTSAALTTTTTIEVPPPASSTTTTTPVPAWSSVTLDDAVRILALWGTAADNIYAAGGNTKTNTAVLFRFDGVEWSEALRVPDGGSFSGLWGSTANDIFAVGGYSEDMLQKSIIYHYDGTDWSEEYASAMETLFSVRGDAAGEVYAVGAAATGPVVLWHDGNRWKTRYSAVLPGAFFDLWGSQDKLFAAAGTYALPDDPEAPLLLAGKIFYSTDRGLSWITAHETPGVFFRALWGSGKTVCAVGGETAERSQGVVLCSNDEGETWAQENFNASQYCLNDCHGVAANDFYVVGDGADGVMFHYDGDTWTRLQPESGTLPPLFAVWSFDDGSVVAAGGNTILHYRP